MSKGLVIYGSYAVGKSTLELNLRQWYFGLALTEENFQSDGRICFLGKTAKRAGSVMATGGAESLKSLVGMPCTKWYVATIPSVRKTKLKFVVDFMKSLDELYAICLHSINRQRYLDKRTMHFSGRKSRRVSPCALAQFPSFVGMDCCRSFKTEEMKAAINFAIRLIGFMPGVVQRPFLLEESCDLCRRVADIDTKLSSDGTTAPFSDDERTFVTEKFLS